MQAKLLQLCPTLCDAMDCSRPGSSVHGILQAKEYWSRLPCPSPSPGDLPDPGLTRPPKILTLAALSGLRLGHYLPSVPRSPHQTFWNPQFVFHFQGWAHAIFSAFPCLTPFHLSCLSLVTTSWPACLDWSFVSCPSSEFPGSPCPSSTGLQTLSLSHVPVSAHRACPAWQDVEVAPSNGNLMRATCITAFSNHHILKSNTEIDEINFERVFLNEHHFLSLYWICYHIVSVLCFVSLATRPVGIVAPWPGIKPALPALEGKAFTNGPPGKSLMKLIFFN